MEWEFSSGGYLKVYNDTKVAWFNIYDSKIKIAWQEGVFTSAEWDETLTCVKEAKWDETLTCVKEAKKILRRIGRL